jgi:hypothetical protein
MFDDISLLWEAISKAPKRFVQCTDRFGAFVLCFREIRVDNLLAIDYNFMRIKVDIYDSTFVIGGAFF